jgi:hypothetical protein
LDALWELAESPSDRVRLLFVENAVETPSKARQLRNRAELALHAAAGLDRQRRERVEAILLRHLRDDSTSLAFREEVAQAAAQANPSSELAAAAARILTEALAKETNPVARSYLAEGLSAVAARLGPEEAARLLTEALAKETDSRDKRSLTQGLVTVSVRLGPEEAVQRSLLAARAVVSTAPLPPLAGMAPWTLAGQPLPSRFTAQELVDLLKMPTCVGLARESFLKLLGERYHRAFADQWEFVDYAHEHLPDIDLKTPPKRPKPVAAVAKP